MLTLIWILFVCQAQFSVEKFSSPYKNSFYAVHVLSALMKILKCCYNRFYEISQ